MCLENEACILHTLCIHILIAPVLSLLLGSPSTFVQSDDPDLCFVFSLYLHKLLSLLLLLPISRERMRHLRQAALTLSSRQPRTHALAQEGPPPRALALSQPLFSPDPHLAALPPAPPHAAIGPLYSPAGQVYLPRSAGGEGMDGGYQHYSQANARGGTSPTAGAWADAVAGASEGRLGLEERQQQQRQCKHEEQEAIRCSAFFRLLGVMGAVYERQPQLAAGNAGLWQFVVFAGEEQCSPRYALVLLRLLASLVSTAATRHVPAVAAAPQGKCWIQARDGLTCTRAH